MPVTSKTVSLGQSECWKINSRLEIYAKHLSDATFLNVSVFPQQNYENMHYSIGNLYYLVMICLGVDLGLSLIQL